MTATEGSRGGGEGQGPAVWDLDLELRIEMGDLARRATVGSAVGGDSSLLALPPQAAEAAPSTPPAARTGGANRLYDPSAYAHVAATRPASSPPASGAAVAAATAPLAPPHQAAATAPALDVEAQSRCAHSKGKCSDDFHYDDGCHTERKTSPSPSSDAVVPLNGCSYSSISYGFQFFYMQATCLQLLIASIPHRCVISSAEVLMNI